MLALLSLARSSKPVRAEFRGGISLWDILEDLLFVVIFGVGAGGGLDDELTLDLEEDVVGCEWSLGLRGRRGFRFSRRGHSTRC